MRGRVLLTVAFLVALVAPPTAADTVRLEVTDASDQPRGDFLRDETIVFRITVTADATRAYEARVFVYRDGDNVAVAGDGSVTNVPAGTTRTLRIPWDQSGDSGWVGPGLYQAQYRLPDGGTVTATFRIEYAPDHEVTHLAAWEVTETGAAAFHVSGCVRNVGVAPPKGDMVLVAVEGRGAALGQWTPQQVLRVAYGGSCPALPGGGSSFATTFVAAALPDGVQLRALRAVANPLATDWEPDRENNAREVAARGLL